MMVSVGFWHGFEVKRKAVHDEKILECRGSLELIEDGFFSGSAPMRAMPLRESAQRGAGRNGAP